MALSRAMFRGLYAFSDTDFVDVPAECPWWTMFCILCMTLFCVVIFVLINSDSV